MAKQKKQQKAQQAKVKNRDPSPEKPSEDAKTLSKTLSEMTSKDPPEMVIDLPTEESEIFGADFQRFDRYIGECVKYNDAVQGHFDRLQKQIESSNSRESAIKRKIDDEVINNNKREKEVLSVVHELQEAYDRNTKKLRDHHQQQISRLVDKHKLEIAKWKSKYEKIKFDKTVKTDNAEKAEKADKIEPTVDLAVDHGDELVEIKSELELTKKNLNRKTDVCNYLRGELAKYKSKVSELQCFIENEKKESTEYLQEKERFQQELEKNKHALENKDSEILKLNCNMDENIKNLEMKLKEIKDLQFNEKKWKDKCTEFEKKHQILLLEIESIKRKNAALRLEIQRKDTELDNVISEKSKLKKSHEALKKVCSELEVQVESFSQKFTNASSAKKNLQQQQYSISDEMSHLKNELYLANQKYNQIYSEKESILNKLTNKEHELKIMLTNEKNRIQNLQNDLEMAQDSVSRLEDKVAWLEANLEDSNSIIKRLEQDNAIINEQLVKIKEEASGYISEIYELKKEKGELEEQLYIADAHEKALRTTNHELRKYFEMQEAELHQRKYTYDETTAQQMKLIEYLTQQSDDKLNKRKASLFPLKIGHSLEQKYQEAQRELVAQKARNIMLNEQLTNANADLSKHLSEVEFLTSEINDLKNRLINGH